MAVMFKPKLDLRKRQTCGLSRHPRGLQIVTATTVLVTAISLCCFHTRHEVPGDDSMTNVALVGQLMDMWDLTSQLLPRMFSYKFTPDNLPVEDDAVSVLTYNVNMKLALHGKMDAKAARVIDAIHVSKADIVLLQEAHRGWQALLKAKMSKLRHQVFHWDASGGIAILSRWPVRSYHCLPLPRIVNGSVFHALVADIMIRGRVWTVANVHLRPPLAIHARTSLATARVTEPIRVQEVRALMQLLKSSPPAVVAGDFNEQDWGQALRWLLHVPGLRDALHEFVPRWRETHLWPLGSLGLTLRKRLDHVTYDADALICLGCGVLSGYEHGASDHQPVLARFAPLIPY